MFSFLKKKPTGQKITFKIKGMHCTSCAMNIDGALEDTDGVVSATTSYAKAQVVIAYNEKKVSSEQLVRIIEEQGYLVVK